MTYTEKLAAKRTAWQENTVEKIKQKLLLLSGDAANTNLKKENFVAVYSATPQVGKTTLILHLIGIKSRSVEEVNRILRAGVVAGHSSTSTAIIYKKSENENWQIVRDENPSSAKEFDKDEDFQSELKKLRKGVESNNLTQEITFIHIPQRYFENTNEESSLMVLDMPGDGSANTDEEPHLRLLYQKHLAVSAANIVVTNFNNIQELEHISFPNKDKKNWWRKSSSYMVVATKAYCQDSEKKELVANNWSYQKIKSKAQEELTQVLHDSDLEIFPIEIGDSFNALLKEYKADKDNLIASQKEALSDIRKSIETRAIQNLNLNGMISNLRDTIKSESNQIKTEIEEEIKDIKNEINNLEHKRKENNLAKELFFSKQSNLTEEIVKLKRKIDSPSFGLSQKEYALNDFSGCNKHEDILHRFEEEILNIQRETDQLCMENKIDYEKIKGIKDNHSDAEKYIEERKKFLFIRLKYVHSSDECKQYACDSLNEYSKSVNKKISEQKKIQDESELQEKCDERETYEKCIASYARKIARREGQIKINKDKLEKLNGKKTELEEMKNRDTATLDDYLALAEQCFCEQKQSLENSLHKDISAEEKFIILLYENILQDDFKAIMEEKKHD